MSDNKLEMDINRIVALNQTMDKIREKAVNFLKILNSSPKKEDVKINKLADETEYIPISNIEMTLDELFFGLWQTTDFKHEVIGNEIVGSIQLTVIHPTLQVPLTRTGTAAVPVRQKKGSETIDVSSTKIKTALVMDYPHLEAQCIKSAAKKFGKIFGRDLNRDFYDNYNPIIQKKDPVEDQVINDVKEGMGIHE